MTRHYFENPTTVYICDCCKRVIKCKGNANFDEPDLLGWVESPGLFTNTEQHACSFCISKRNKTRKESDS